LALNGGDSLKWRHPHTHSTATMQPLRIAECIFYASGIIGGLVIYGLLQERIVTMPYGTPPVHFEDTMFLVFLNRAVAVVFSFIMTLGKGESLRHVAPLWKYMAISVSNVYASTCQYEALKYVSFPTQMLAKSFKMMPVMVWGIIVSNKKYSMADWMIAACVTGGVTEFLLTGPISKHADHSDSMFGLGLLVVFLALDGFTSTKQEYLFREYATTKYNQMLYVNLCSCFISAATLLLTGQMYSALAFARDHPAFLADASMLSTSAVGSQWFIYSLIKEFGALVFAATMNVRQVFSILLSYAKYGHSISALQIVGLFLVFAGLFAKTFIGLVQTPNEETRPLTKKSEKEDAAGAQA